MKITDVKPARIIAVLCVICGAGCITATIIALSSMGAIYGMAPEPGDILTYFYQINGFFCAFAILLGLAVLIAKRRRCILAKTAVWGLLILAVMYVTPFVTDTIAYLSAMEFLAAFRYTCAYLPYFMIAGAATAVLTTWNSGSHTTAGIISMACSLAAVFASVVYLWQVAPAAASSESAFDAAQIWAIIFGFVTVTTTTLLMWFGTLSEHVWLRVFFAESNEEASVAEEANRREREGRAQLEEQVREDLLKEAAEKDAGSEEQSGDSGDASEESTESEENGESGSAPVSLQKETQTEDGQAEGEHAQGEYAQGGHAQEDHTDRSRAEIASESSASEPQAADVKDIRTSSNPEDGE